MQVVTALCPLLLLPVSYSGDGVGVEGVATECERERLGGWWIGLWWIAKMSRADHTRAGQNDFSRSRSPTPFFILLTSPKAAQTRVHAGVVVSAEQQEQPVRWRCLAGHRGQGGLFLWTKQPKRPTTTADRPIQGCLCWRPLDKVGRLLSLSRMRSFTSILAVDALPLPASQRQQGWRCTATPQRAQLTNHEVVDTSMCETTCSCARWSREGWNSSETKSARRKENCWWYRMAV